MSKTKARKSQKPAEEAAPARPSTEDPADLEDNLVNAIQNFQFTDIKSGMLVLCRHTDSFFYEAKIISVAQDEHGHPLYTVHYNGWNSRYDEVLSHSVAMTRFIERTDANVAMATKAIAVAKKRQKQLKGKRDDIRRKRQEPKRTDANAEENQEFPVAFEKPVATNKAKSMYARPKFRPLQLSTNLEQFILADIAACDAKKIVKLPARITIKDIIAQFIEQLPEDPKIYPDDPYEKERIEGNLQMLKAMFTDVAHDFLLLETEVSSYYTLVNEQREDLGLPLVEPYPSRDHVVRVPTPVTDDDTNRTERETLPHLRDVREAGGTRKVRPRRSASNRKSSIPTPQVAEPDPEPDLTTVYGFCHLVRFLFEFSNIVVPRTAINDPGALIIHDELVTIAEPLAKYIDEQKDELFDPDLDYEPFEEESP